MTTHCLTSQMTGFDAYFLLLRVNVILPCQKVIVYVYHLTIYRITVSLICSMCVMFIPYTGSTPLPYIMVCGDPESGTDHSLKEVSGYSIWYRVHTWGRLGKCHNSFFCTLLCLFTSDIHVSVKNSSAEGICICTYVHINWEAQHWKQLNNKSLVSIMTIKIIFMMIYQTIPWLTLVYFCMLHSD